MQRKEFVIPDAIFQRMASVIGEVLSKGNNREKTAAARVLLAMAEYNAQGDQAPKQVEHKHTHRMELGPVTAENLVEHKRRLLEELGS